ncbi:hypothetical protein [Streptomyces massasporeus]|uniref:hypothetical protein n=1 Tax=Streptomyces massasporeus TaxID=67324 RepID=UPI00340D4FDA
MGPTADGATGIGPSTTDADTVREWLTWGAVGMEGVIYKRLDGARPPCAVADALWHEGDDHGLLDGLGVAVVVEVDGLGGAAPVDHLAQRRELGSIDANTSTGRAECLHQADNSHQAGKDCNEVERPAIGSRCEQTQNACAST